MYVLTVSLSVCLHVLYVCQRVDEACTNCLNTISHVTLEHRHIRTYVHSVVTHMTHTVWANTELYRLRIHCRRVLVGCAVGVLHKVVGTSTR